MTCVKAAQIQTHRQIPPPLTNSITWLDLNPTDRVVTKVRRRSLHVEHEDTSLTCRLASAGEPVIDRFQAAWQGSIAGSSRMNFSVLRYQNKLVTESRKMKKIRVLSSIFRYIIVIPTDLTASWLF